MGPFLGERVDRGIDIPSVVVFLVGPSLCTIDVTMSMSSFKFGLSRNQNVLKVNALIMRRNARVPVPPDL